MYSTDTQETSYPHQTLFGLPFFKGNVTEAIDFIWKKVLDNEFIAIATPNPEQIIQAKEYPPFGKALQTFEVVLPDGQGIIWAARKLRKPLNERIPGVDVVKQLLEEMSSTDAIGLVVGGWGYDEAVKAQQQPTTELKTEAEADQSKAAEIYKERVEKMDELAEEEQLKVDAEAQVVSKPQIRFVPLLLDQLNPTSQEKDSEKKSAKLFWQKNIDRNLLSDTEAALAWIVEHRPMIVFIAFGAPYQELWIAKYRDQLKRAGVRCVMAVGGSFDVLTGQVKRAPDLMQNLGLEWLWRLIKQPWRWKRQLRLLSFVGMVVSRKAD